MKTLAPCCDTAAELACTERSATHEDVPYIPLLARHGYGEVKFCPWCGKRFEVVEA